MPIPDAPSGPGATAAIAALFRQVHDDLRSELQGLDDGAINWLPVPGSNSIATIVTHIVGSEAETVRSVAGVECERDRDAEFVGQGLTIREVLLLLDGADDLISELEPRISLDRLTMAIRLPTLPAEELRPGLTWLVGNYGHAREHLGQVQLTRQLLRSAPPN